MAFTESELAHELPPTWSMAQQTLYMASRAAGAIPDAVPTGCPLITAVTPKLPATVDDVWLPCPVQSGVEIVSSWLTPSLTTDLTPGWAAIDAASRGVIRAEKPANVYV